MKNLTLLTKNSTSRIKPKKKRKSENTFKTLGSRETRSGQTNAEHTNTGVTFRAHIFKKI